MNWLIGIGYSNIMKTNIVTNTSINIIYLMNKLSSLWLYLSDSIIIINMYPLC